MWFGFNIVYHATAVGALWITLHNFPSLNGWDFKEIAFMYGLWMLGHGINNTFFFTIGNVPEFVREGRFDRFLVRPQDPLFSVITVPQQIYPDELLLAITFFIVVVPFSGVHVDLAFILYVPLVAIGGALIDGGLTLFIATLSFWIVRVDAIRWVLFSLEQEFLRYPISIYQRSVRIVLTFVLPFAFMAYFPATWLLQKQDLGLHLAPIAGLLTPVIGVAWMGLAYAFWRIGINRYQGTGS